MAPGGTYTHMTDEILHSGERAGSRDPAIRDRDSGIWRQVTLSATGPVAMKDPLVTTDLPLPKTDTSDVAVQTTVTNLTDQPQKGVVRGTIENISFTREVELAPHSTQQVSFDAKNTPALHMDHPRLWWPNGYGEQNMYHLHLDFSSATPSATRRTSISACARLRTLFPEPTR